MSYKVMIVLVAIGFLIVSNNADAGGNYDMRCYVSAPTLANMEDFLAESSVRHSVNMDYGRTYVASRDRSVATEAIKNQASYSFDLDVSRQKFDVSLSGKPDNVKKLYRFVLDTLKNYNQRFPLDTVSFICSVEA